MTIFELIQEAHVTAVEKGWWEQDRNIGELLALVHSEVSEALEEWRLGDGLEHRYEDDHGKPAGFVVELADVMIRIADLCGRHDLDLEQALLDKLAYNKTRPHRHGGKIA